MENKKTRIQTETSSYVVDYPEAIEYMNNQQSVFWPHFEVKVVKDKQDILVNMTEAERHGTMETLRLFTEYENRIGDDFWLGFVMKKFPRPADIQPMAAMFAAMELCVHQSFYKTLNEEIGLGTDEFYNSYKLDPELMKRIKFLEDTLGGKDDLRALGNFTYAEGAILYSNFGFLKHFQSQGKNKLLHTVSGINFSSRDENLHAEAAAWLFRQLKKEQYEEGIIDDVYLEELERDIKIGGQTVYEHECLIIDKIFSKGKIEGITDVQLQHFVQSRINLCLRNMGYSNLFKVDYNPIGEWFYKGVNGFMMQDFFNSQGNQYQRDWNTEGFIWSMPSE